MGAEGEERVFSLAPDLWDTGARISEEENLALTEAEKQRVADLLL
jgi:hypothetical protein